ncbi:GHKL domain-containing protein, partial [Listeria monocytogenes]|nr:GHKL domain-containing protein [Listeria monocytogenes]
LEVSQQELRKFKHDYKNLLLSLKELTFENSQETFKKGIRTLEEYSEDYLNSINWQYSDMENLGNLYIKSLFISKIYKIQEAGIDFHFECKYFVEEVPIHVFDLIRMLGISLDNAIEAAIKAEEPKIHVAVIKEKEQLVFIIQNSSVKITESISKLMSVGFSMKEGHLGLGLSNIQEMKKNTRMFICSMKRPRICLPFRLL